MLVSVDINGQEMVNRTEKKFRYYSLLEMTITSPRSLYHSNEKIPVQMIVRNQGDNPVLLHITNLPQTSFFVNLRKNSGKSAASKVDWIKSGQDWHVNLPVSKHDEFNRMSKYILLESKETFSRTIDLQSYFDIKPDQKYTLATYFYPDFLHHRNIVIKSENMIPIEIHQAPVQEYQKDVISKDAKTMQTMPVGLAPDEIVFLHLKAEIEKQPHRFLKYLHLESYIQLFDAYYKQYRLANSRKKRLVMTNFTNFLIRDRKDYLLDFKVLRTVYRSKGGMANNAATSSKQANVMVFVKRYGGTYPDTYIYSYGLVQVRDKGGSRAWRIVDLKVTRRKSTDISHY